MTSRELAPFIKKAVKSLMSMDDGTTFHKQLDDNFAVYVGWGDGFDPKDDTCIHSKKSPSYCICIKVAEYNPYCPLWDNVYMPWFTDDNEVYDTDTSIPYRKNYNEIAKWLLVEYREMRKLLKKGEITFGN